MLPHNGTVCQTSVFNKIFQNAEQKFSYMAHITRLMIIHSTYTVAGIIQWQILFIKKLLTFTSPTEKQSLKLKNVVTILLKVKNCTIRINLLYGWMVSHFLSLHHKISSTENMEVIVLNAIRSHFMLFIFWLLYYYFTQSETHRDNISCKNTIIRYEWLLWSIKFGKFSILV
jgi:hypothetical protein